MGNVFGGALAVALFSAALGGQDASVRFEVASVRANTGSDLSIPFGPTPPDGIALVTIPSTA